MATLAAKGWQHCTSLVAARACRPRLLVRVSLRLGTLTLPWLRQAYPLRLAVPAARVLTYECLAHGGAGGRQTAVGPAVGPIARSGRPSDVALRCSQLPP